MADGAAQRLVAQIGEALFGQPGLTLMELAEKVKGMRSGYTNTCPVAENITDSMYEKGYETGGRPEVTVRVAEALPQVRIRR